MASRANIARKIPGIVVLTMERLVKCGVSMVSIAVAYASQALTTTAARAIAGSSRPTTVTTNEGESVDPWQARAALSEIFHNVAYWSQTNVT